MRRLLDAIQNVPIETTHYALLKRPRWRPPSRCELDRINDKALDYHGRFTHSGIKPPPGKKGPNWRTEISGILQEVQNKASDEQEVVLKELGIKPIWFDDYAEIPEKLHRIRDQVS